MRGWMALDWLVRVHTPPWLRLAGLDEHADRLAGFAEIRPDTVQGVKPALDVALEAARAARDTARDTAWAVMDPKWTAARAAREATWATAWGAVRATEIAAWDAGMVAARATAWNTAMAAAAAAAYAAAGGTAGIAALDPTRRELQQSAHELVDRMLAVTEGDPA